MREILFRGKRTDNCEWVDGSLWIFSTGDFYIVTGWKTYPVIPETVGQYTGLKDKNGVKIFEGDILFSAGTTWLINYHEKNNPNQQAQDLDVLEVCYYGTSFIGRKKPYDDGYPLSTILLQNNSSISIIGNIHDNQELL